MKKRLVITMILAAVLMSACGKNTTETVETAQTAAPEVIQTERAETESAETESAETETAAAQTMQLQILATSDMHGKFMPYDYALNAESTSGSCAQVASAVAELRNENTIVIDAGDSIQDNLAELFLDDDIHPMMLAMNEIGYDVWLAGNHEFNYGMDVLQRVIAQNKAQFLCGNVYDQEQKSLGEDYTIIEKDGVKIGIIGMITPNITRWDAENLKDWTVKDPVEEIRAVVDEIKDEVDVLIAVNHMTIENEYEVPNSGARDVAEACPELDLIIASHGHELIDDLTLNGIPVVENKNMGATLAQVVMDLEQTDEGWKVVNTTTAVLDMSTYDPDPALVEALQPYHERAVENAGMVVGTFESDYLAAPNEIDAIPTAQIEDTALIDLINEVQMHYSGAKVSGATLFVNDANLYKGDIRRCDMAHIYKYSNTLYTLEMTGAQLKKWMEWSASYYNTLKEGDLTISFNENIRGYMYDMFSGVNYEVNISKEPGSRIENLTWPDGTPVEDDEVFTVAANNFRAASHLSKYGSVFKEGEDLPKITEIDVHGEIGSVRELIADYIVNVNGGKLTAFCDHNWKLTGINWDEDTHAKVVELLKEGKLSIPASEDGRTINIRSITVDDLN